MNNLNTLIVLYSYGGREEGDVEYEIYFQSDNNWKFLGGLVYNYRYPMPRTTSEHTGSSINIFLFEWVNDLIDEWMSESSHLTCLTCSPSIFLLQLLLWNRQLASVTRQYLLPAMASIFCLLPRAFFWCNLVGHLPVFWHLCKPGRVRELTLTGQLLTIESWRERINILFSAFLNDTVYGSTEGPKWNNVPVSQSGSILTTEPYFCPLGLHSTINYSHLVLVSGSAFWGSSA